MFQNLKDQCLRASIKLEEIEKVLSSGLVAEQLDSFNKNEIEDVLKVWRLHEIHSWDFIKMTEAYYLEEYKLLEQARQKLRKAWRRLYSAYVAERKTNASREKRASGCKEAS